MNIKPGDLFEWIYKDDNDNSPVVKNEKLYSYAMEKWVPCGGLCLCIGINENIIHCVSANGLFHVWGDYPSPALPLARSMFVIPRKI